MASSKPALILAHGYRGSPLGLKEVKAALGGYEVYTPAIPPFGGAGELAEYTPESYAQYLAKWIKQMKLKNPVLVGHSMGSIVVAATAAKYPELVNDKVIFLSPIAKKPAKWIAKIAPLATLLPNKLVSYATTKYLFVPHNKKLFKKALDLTVSCGADCDSKKGSRAAAKFSSSYCINDFDFQKKALFIAGEKDRLNSQEDVKKVAKKYDAEVKFLENCGHICNYEAPKKVAQAISDWI